jgi:hypothetical protein
VLATNTMLVRENAIRRVVGFCRWRACYLTS